MPWISQIVLIGLIGFKSYVETHVVIGIDDITTIITMYATEIRSHSGDSSQIAVAVGNQFGSVLWILEFEEDDVVDSGWSGWSTPNSQNSCHKAHQDPCCPGLIHHGEYSRVVKSTSQDKSRRTAVTVQSLSSHRTDEAIELASSLGIKHVSQSDDPIPEGELRIVLLDDRMELWDQFSRRRGMRVGFQSIDRRVGNGSLSHKQPLARAIGKSARTIVDATAGLGHDSFLMACMGWHVKAIERHPVIGVLLKESVRDAITHPDLSLAIEDRLVVHQGDAVEILGDMDAPDVIYLDPMFQDVHGSALPRKPAQILRKVVPLDGIEEQIGLFEVSRNLARQRVVVKRSDKSPPLVDGSDISYHGKIVRYDVYLTGT